MYECVQAKQNKGKFNKDASYRTKHRIGMVYFNVCGSMQVDLFSGNKYSVIFINDYSKSLWTYLIKIKYEVFEVFKKFKSMIERQSGHKLKILKVDGGDEYISNDLRIFMIKSG